MEYAYWRWSARTLIDEINYYLSLLFPLNRSITGSDNKKSLEILQQIIPIDIKEYDSGTKVYDWTIPDEWNIEDAWIKDSYGNKIIDFKVSNIHVLSYSTPINKKIVFKELKNNLFVHEKLTEAIPYRTSYYNKNWGFCVSSDQYNQLKAAVGELEIVIKSEFNANGKMVIGELLIPGSSNQEILLSTYICHPSLANDNLSGMVMTAFLAKELQKIKNLKYSYRIIWVPETIGAISYCFMNENAMKRIDMGLVITTVGGLGDFGYKQSWQPEHPINKLIEEVFLDSGNSFIKYPFDIHGSDERQYSSQAFRINVATISKDKYYEYPEYHTSLDNLSIVSGSQISQSLDLYIKLIDKIESRRVYRNLSPFCEVMLSKHNLYPKYGGAQTPELKGKTDLDIILWALFLCDGNLSTSDISEKIDVEVESINRICEVLSNKGILEEI